MHSKYFAQYAWKISNYIPLTACAQEGAGNPNQKVLPQIMLQNQIAAKHLTQMSL